MNESMVVDEHEEDLIDTIIDRVERRNDRIMDAAEMLRNWSKDMRVALRDLESKMEDIEDDPYTLLDVDMRDIEDTFRQLGRYPRQHLNTLINLSK